MKVFVKYPVTVRVDNVGAMSSNITTMSWTKNDIKYKYVNECAEDEIVKFIIVKFADNETTFSPKT